MRTTMIGVFALAALAGVISLAGRTTRAQAPREVGLLEWPLPPGESAYGKIDGKHLHRYVEEQAAISRRYRDQGHPKFWGRIIGSSADAENAEWLPHTVKVVGGENGSNPPPAPQP